MFNQEIYNTILTAISPKKIESEEQYEQYLLLVEPILFNKERTEEYKIVAHILVLLIEEYENKHYFIPETEFSPLDLLLHLMEAKGLKQKDLVGILGSKGVVSEVINGKREITKAQAKALGQYFNMSYKDFL